MVGEPGGEPGFRQVPVRLGSADSPKLHLTPDHLAMQAALVAPDKGGSERSTELHRR
jgi:hypothetical protein